MENEPVRIPVTDVFDLHSVPDADVRAIIEEYLIEARKCGFRHLRIIHGRGIGVRREMVRAILARTEFVESYRDAPAEAGGWGATLVGQLSLSWSREWMSQNTVMAELRPSTAPTPAQLGFSMPAEWERHEATWLGWPHHATDWPYKLDTTRWVYAEIVRKIAPGETVRMLVRSANEERLARRYLTRAGADAGPVEFIVHPTNRSWMRDSGPVFVRHGRETAIVHFHFNAWAKYDDWQQDRRVPEVAAKQLKKRLFHAQVGGREFVLEGGGIDVNGRGTLLTTEECYLDPDTQVRNPGLGRAEFEGALKENLGVTNVLWLGGGVVGDDTHGHVDDICRFVDPKTLVLIREENPSDINYRPLAENWERVQGLSPGRRFEARGGGAAHAGAAALRGGAAAGELREFLCRQRGGDRAHLQRPERPGGAGDIGRVIQRSPGGGHSCRGSGAGLRYAALSDAAAAGVRVRGALTAIRLRCGSWGCLWILRGGRRAGRVLLHEAFESLLLLE